VTLAEGCGRDDDVGYDIVSERLSIILATSNGTGMGHLARASATALALADRADPVIFSLSRALPLVRSLGLRGEYCPSHHSRPMAAPTWQSYLSERIIALAAETKARVFAFDGAWPYSGIAFARAKMPEMAFVWVRRGMWRPGSNIAALARAQPFDVVLEPGDLAAAADRGATASRNDATRVAPMTLLEQVARISRAEARVALGLDPDRPVALVTLRTDSPGADSAGASAIRVLLRQPEWQIALTRTPLTVSELVLETDRIVPLKEVFPLASYLSAFDATVTAAGYNSFHEMLYAGVPTLFVPTKAAVTDDQQARARWALDHGLALAAAEDQPTDVAGATETLLDLAVREKLVTRYAEIPAPCGAHEAASVLADLAARFEHHRFSARERLDTARRKARPLATTMLGPRTVQRLERLIGRAEETVPRPPGPVRFIEEADTEDLASGLPVEDLLLGASATYRARRKDIADRYYGRGPVGG
jgi:hypothetical protein